MRRSVLHGHGLSTSNATTVEAAVDAFEKLESTYPGYLRSPLDIYPKTGPFIPICVPSIAQQADFSNYPMITDTTYRCFNKGTYLCSTSMYFDDVGRHLVIFQAVLNGQTSEHFRRYFCSFFDVYRDQLECLLGDGEESIGFSGLVMDFSLPQRSGFEQAYRETFPTSSIPASTLVKGCYFHWKKSVEKMRKLRSAVSRGDGEKKFLEYTKTMYEASSPEIFDGAVMAICNNFEGLAKWIAWWSRPQIRSMIFYNSQQTLIDKLKNDLGRTTNAAESFHRDLYHKVVQDQPLINTLDSILAYLAQSDRLLEVGKEGIPTDYTHRRQKSKTRYVHGLVAGL